MKTQTSKQKRWLKGLLVLPLVAVLVYGFSQKETVFEDEMPNKTLSGIQNNSEGATEAMMIEYKTFIADFKKTRTIKNDSYERAQAIFELMSESQKQSVETLPELPFKLRASLKKSVSTPTSGLLKQWKDKSNYAVWIDGKVIDNSTLSNYAASDFVHFFQSKVYKNARSAQFPQPFQVSLYTEPYYKANFTNREVKEYQRLAKNYTDALGEWLKGNRSDNSELKLLKALADKVYNSLSQSKIDEFNLRPTPPLPATSIKDKIQYDETKTKNKKLYGRSVELKILNNDSYLIDGIKASKKTFLKVFNQLHQDISVETRKRILNIHVSSTDKISNKEVWFIYNSLQDYGFYRIVTPNQEINRAKGNTPFAIEEDIKKQNLQEGATKKQMELYNKLAKHYNSMSKKNFNIKMKEVEQMKYIYGIMTDAQKKNAEPFPSLPDAPPPPPPAPKNATPAQKMQYEKYQKEYKERVNKARQKQKIAKGELESKKAKKVVSVEEVELPAPPPPPIPENATEEQKKRYKKIIAEYAKKNPKSKSKVKTKSGEVIEVVEVPSKLLEVPPPPPPPMDMKELAKEGAEFYYEGKKISSEKALELYNKNKDLNVQVMDYGKGNPKVKLSKEPIKLKRKN